MKETVYHTAKKMYAYEGKTYIATSKAEVLRSLGITPNDNLTAKVKTLVFSINKNEKHI